MKKFKTLKQTFGINEYGLIDFPKKISNVQISRILYGDEMGCSWCFPHGFETINSKEIKIQRNWKKYRKTQWKNKSKCRKTEFLR
ncbi:phosphate ABC transporter substrate-binding protein [Chryseobacterium sp. C-71]|uniref:phosphate ABC transporter substrate-binding protein n=1 Tax=Chryseobacterium sp. C-71 TaxID=2893882 RepID=UPI001E5BAA31|nr:phosphate ABC transporter substrate-binding protein [Chryseobacterium sp. C-71]UFH33394.1 phosphate ABC transporter substrate-binding protein [Chryseobacterium sp. C-71]